MAVTGRPAAAGGDPRRWLAAIVMIVGALMDMIDVTIVNVALPTIRRDLHASATQLEWVVSAYMLAFAAALIIAGNLGDLFGRKRVFLTGVAVFGLASLAAGLSQSGAELIAARVVQGTAAVEAAGGASGLFGTAQQLGGALGVAVFGTVFFGYLSGHSFGASIVHTAPYAMGAFALCAVLSMLLPRTAVAGEALIES